jgi:hypothetical protein
MLGEKAWQLGMCGGVARGWPSSLGDWLPHWMFPLKRLLEWGKSWRFCAALASGCLLNPLQKLCSAAVVVAVVAVIAHREWNW